MRIGFHDKWQYDGFPSNAEAVTISEGGNSEQIPLEEMPGIFVEREYDRRFPDRTPATDNEELLARFRRLAGKSSRISKDVENAGTQLTRREETYARLAEKMRGNKWFDEHA